MSREGVVPITSLFDSPGPMTKSVRDLADILDVIMDETKVSIPQGGFASLMVNDWSNIEVATLDPEEWTFPDVARKPDAGATKQMVSSTTQAQR